MGLMAPTCVHRDAPHASSVWVNRTFSEHMRSEHETRQTDASEPAELEEDEERNLEDVEA